MSKIFRAELYRLNKNKTFWIMLIVLAALPLVGLIMVEALLALLRVVGEDISSFGEIAMSTLTQAASFDTIADLLAVICSATFLAKEFTEGPIRNAVLSNKNRTQVFFSYLITAVLIGVVYKLTMMVCYTTVYGIAWGFGDQSGWQVVSAILVSAMLGLISTVFIQSFTAMCLFVSRKQATSLVFPILLQVFGVSLFEIVVTVVSLVLAQKGITSFDWQTWLPLYNITFYEAAAIDGALVGKIVMWLVPLTALFIYLGWNGFRKADLK